MDNSIENKKDPATIFKQIFAEADEAVAQLKSLMPQINQRIKQAVNNFSRISQQVLEILAPTVQLIKEVLEKAPEATRNALAILGQNGWYISLNMPIDAVFALSAKLTEGDVKTVD